MLARMSRNDDADTRPPSGNRSRRVRERIRAERSKVDTDAVKVRAGAKAGEMIKRARRHPLVLGGLSLGGGGTVYGLAKQLLQVSDPASWIFFGLGVGLVIAYGALDYFASLSGHVENQSHAVDDIRDMVAEGFDEGEERFERIERKFDEHLANHPGPSKPKRKSNNAMRPLRVADIDDTAVVPPVIDLDDPPPLSPE